ncbi:MAG: hypothetical protein VB957_04230 [Pseudomonadales bacterium]
MKDQEAYRSEFISLARAKGIDDPAYYDAILAIVDMIEKKRVDKATVTITVGIAGAQGCGKSTLAELLALVLEDTIGLGSEVLSLDDFYKTRQERVELAQSVHPLFSVRGVPGTHDMEMLNQVVADLTVGKTTKKPIFNKAEDDRSRDFKIVTPVDIIILEGWCWGAMPADEESLINPVNELETIEDQDGVWRRAVNDGLASTSYQQAFNNDLNIFLAVPSMDAVFRWRAQQEQELKVGTQVMDETAIRRFIMYYERITRDMLNRLPRQVDLTLRLNEDHSIAPFSKTKPSNTKQ